MEPDRQAGQAQCKKEQDPFNNPRLSQNLFAGL